MRTATPATSSEDNGSGRVARLSATLGGAGGRLLVTSEDRRRLGAVCDGLVQRRCCWGAAAEQSARAQLASAESYASVQHGRSSRRLWIGRPWFEPDVLLKFSLLRFFSSSFLLLYPPSLFPSSLASFLPPTSLLFSSRVPSSLLASPPVPSRLLSHVYPSSVFPSSTLPTHPLLFFFSSLFVSTQNLTIPYRSVLT